MLYQELPKPDRETIEEDLKNLLPHIFVYFKHPKGDPLYEYVVDYSLNTLLGRSGIRCDELLGHALISAKVTYAYSKDYRSAKRTISLTFPGAAGASQVMMSQDRHLPAVELSIQEEMMKKTVTTLEVHLWPQEKDNAGTTEESGQPST